MFKKLFAVGLLSVGLIAGGFQVVNAESDKDCGDFSSHEEVMAFWYDNGYSAENDPHRLDGRGNSVDDGIPCEVSADEWNQYVADKKAEKNSDADSTEEESTTTESNDDSSNKSDDQKGGELPDTATNNPMMMLVGAMVVALGGLFFIRKKQIN
ncbi:LPXTG cell wall anchor domain-containing protein [Pseudalkalibacillus decolorationis]|uniref:LPXTG cell wall anchor domain-containing protein n=1 Tax=Pseudalkalibacillus decolorationis TaxID=163879 RepID=UPI00214882A3|nr:LPXTG cell wall anchor domain-containing protein [Pseudalkalibacillus decolorationis]